MNTLSLNGKADGDKNYDVVMNECRSLTRWERTVVDDHSVEDLILNVPLMGSGGYMWQ